MKSPFETDRFRGLADQDALKAERSLVSSGSARVRIQQPAESRGADDLTRHSCVVRLRRFVPIGWEVVAGGVRSFGVVPCGRFFKDVVEVSFVEDDQSIQNLVLQCLNDPLDMCP